MHSSLLPPVVPKRRLLSHPAQCGVALSPSAVAYRVTRWLPRFLFVIAATGALSVAARTNQPLKGLLCLQ